MTESTDSPFCLLVDLDEELLEAFVEDDTDESFRWYEAIRHIAFLDSGCNRELNFWDNKPETLEKVIAYLGERIFSKCDLVSVRQHMAYHRQLTLMYEFFLRYTEELHKNDSKVAA